MKFGAKFWFFGCKFDLFANFKIPFTHKNLLLILSLAKLVAKIRV
ncbi:hypothetical protein [Campylobacter concisus]|nr:hypothetical protein [Campylobacter concisus]